MQGKYTEISLEKNRFVFPSALLYIASMMEPNETGTKRLLALIPLLLFVHNIEEALTMPAWVPLHLPMLRERLPLFRALEFSTPQLYTSLTLVSVVPALFTWYCLRGTVMPKRVTMLLILQGIIFWNALMPHLSGTLILGLYNPGTVTAVLINIPFTILLFRSRLVTHLSRPRILTWSAALYLPLVYTNHLLAKGISQLF